MSFSRKKKGETSGAIFRYDHTMSQNSRENLETVQDVDESDLIQSHLSDDRIQTIIELYEAKELDQVRQNLKDWHPDDIATLLEKVPDSLTQDMVVTLRDVMPAEVFAYMEPSTAKFVLATLGPSDIATIITDLDTDDTLELIEDLPEDARREILRYVSKRIRRLVEEGLTFPEDSAGRLMQRKFLAVPDFWTVGKALDYLKGLGDELPEDAHMVSVVDARFHVVGKVPFVALMRHGRSKKLMSLVEDSPPVITIPVTMDQEEVSLIFGKERLISAPVVDEDGRLLGVITIDDIVDVVREEADEDILRLGGVGESDLFRPILATTRARFSWLFVNLLTAILASVAIGMFEATLDQVVALAVLMPIVASMGGNAGTQTLTVTVRALAMHELSNTNAWRVIRKEVIVGAANGVAFAILVGLVAWGWFHSAPIGAVIAIAMIFNLIIAGFCGVLIPMTLDRFKIDPALASSVFLTTVTDLVGFGLFLGLASVILL